MALLQKNCGLCFYQICSQAELVVGRCLAEKLFISQALLRKLLSPLEEGLHMYNMAVILLDNDLDKKSVLQQGNNSSLRWFVDTLEIKKQVQVKRVEVMKLIIF